MYNPNEYNSSDEMFKVLTEDEELTGPLDKLYAEGDNNGEEQIHNQFAQPITAPETRNADLDVDTLVRLLYVSEEAYFNFFIPEELILEVPELHKVVFRRMTDLNPKRKKKVFALPRGHAKTTIAKLAVSKLFLFTDLKHGVFVSKTQGHATHCVDDIIDYLQTPNCEALFGPMKDFRKNTTKGIYTWTMNYVKFNHKDGSYVFKEKKCILHAKGARQQIRGLNINNQRPQFAVVDDFESKEEMQKEDNYTALKGWFYGTFMKALDKLTGGYIIQIGNLVSKFSILNDHILDPEWDSMLFGVLKANGKPLWPELWPVEDIIADFRTYQFQNQVATWYAEMMNLPMPPSGRLIRLDQIKYTAPIAPNGGSYQYGFITVDPAISDKTWGHNTAIVVHVFTGVSWVPAEIIAEKGMSPQRLFATLKLLCDKWHLHVVGIESVAYQAALMPLFNGYMKHVEGVPWIEFVPVPAGYATKTQRISSWASMLMSKEFQLPVGDNRIVNQLLNYDPTAESNDDDVIDSCAQAPYMLKNYITRVMEQRKIVSDESQDAEYDDLAARAAI